MRLIVTPLLATLLISSRLLSAQQEPTPPQDKCALEGKVVNLVTGEPVPKARLTLSAVQQEQEQQQPAAPLFVVSTDAQGKFAFADLEPGAYRLAARHDNYSNRQYGARKPGQPVEPILLAPGTKKIDLEIRLAPYATIAGRIRDEDGDPMQQVPVAVMAYEYTNSGRQLTERSTATTNDLGEYRIFNLAPGKYYLGVSPTPMRGLRNGDAGDAEDSFVAVYYPNSPDPSGASPLQLTPGQQLTSVDFTLHRTHAATISGRIVKPAGGDGLSIGLTVVTNNGTSSYSTTNGIDADGKFEMRGISAGAYFLNGYCNVGDRRYTASLPIQVGGADIDKLEMHLAAPADVTGRVRIEGETQVKLTQVRVNLDGQGRSPGSDGGTVMEDGAFGFRNVEPDVFHVNVDVPGELYLKSVTWGSNDVTESGLDLGAAAPNADLEIVVSANGGQIDGKVENDKSEPVDNALVTLVPPGARRNRTFFKSVRTTPDGHFTITGVAPGTYKLFAWDDVEVNAVLYDPDFLRPFEAAGQSIQVFERARHAATLKLLVKPSE